jgi:hypothetical protein
VLAARTKAALNSIKMSLLRWIGRSTPFVWRNLRYAVADLQRCISIGILREDYHQWERRA